jgi:hypothetical protein
MRTPLILLAFFLGSQPALPGELRHIPAADAGDIARLITQLGSSKFKDREAAAQALNTTGAAALDALRQAAQHRDPEVRHRAAVLAQEIHKRLETAALLEPKQVHLVYEDTLLSTAAADFARKTGFPIEVANVGRDQRITLDTGVTSFWQAFDQFCRKADLVERVTQTASTQEVRVWTARGNVAGQAVLFANNTYPQGTAHSDGRLTLTHGKPQQLPTCYSGAVRIQALPANGKQWQRGKDETLLVLEVTPQPRMAWLGTQDVRIDRALDEHGQTLTQVLAGGPNDLVASARRMGNGVIVLDAETGRPIADPRDTAVRLKRAEKSSKLLKEVRGVVTAQVQTPLQPLLTVDQILKSGGKTIQGEDGALLKVLDIARQENGDIKVRLQLEHHLQGVGGMNRRMVMRGNRILLRNGVVMRGGLTRESGSAGEANLALLDAAGKRFELVDTGYTLVATGNGVAQEIHSIYRPHAGQGEPAQLVYTNRRTVAIEVPFTLKDVPLP